MQQQQQAAQVSTVVSHPECFRNSDRPVTTRNCVSFILTSICCVAAIVSGGLALVCLGREQTTSAHLERVTGELREIRIQLVELESRCGPARASTVVPEEADYAVSDNSSGEDEVPAADDVIYIETPDADKVRRRRQATGRQNLDSGKSKDKKKSTGTSSRSENDNVGSKKKSPGAEANKASKSETSLDMIVHMQPEGEKTNIVLHDKVMHGWEVSSHSKKSSRHPLHDRQTLVIDKSGHYLVYAQIGYYTNAIENGFTIAVAASSSDASHKSRVLTRCMLGVDRVDELSASSDNRRFKTCHTSTVTYLSANERIQLHDESLASVVDFYPAPETHFWGVVRLAVDSKRNT